MPACARSRGSPRRRPSSTPLRRRAPDLPIDYEELGEVTSAWSSCSGFLGLDPEPLRSWYERLRTRPLMETVENWDEIVAALAGTPYEAFTRDLG